MNDAEKNTVTADIGLLLLRLGTGLVMAFGHGWGKLMTFSEKASEFADPLGIGSELSLTATVAAEFFAALLVVIGLGTRFASAALVFTMAVAAFVVHGSDPFGTQEKAILFGVMFLVLTVTGAGRFSLDHQISSMREK